MRHEVRHTLKASKASAHPLEPGKQGAHAAQVAGEIVDLQRLHVSSREHGADGFARGDSGGGDDGGDPRFIPVGVMWIALPKVGEDGCSLELA